MCSFEHQSSWKMRMYFVVFPSPFRIEFNCFDFFFRHRFALTVLKIIVVVGNFQIWFGLCSLLPWSNWRHEIHSQTNIDQNHLMHRHKAFQRLDKQVWTKRETQHFCSISSIGVLSLCNISLLWATRWQKNRSIISFCFFFRPNKYKLFTYDLQYFFNWSTVSVSLATWPLALVLRQFYEKKKTLFSNVDMDDWITFFSHFLNGNGIFISSLDMKLRTTKKKRTMKSKWKCFTENGIESEVDVNSDTNWCGRKKYQTTH